LVVHHEARIREFVARCHGAGGHPSADKEDWL